MGGVSVPSQSWTQSLSPFSLEKGLRMKSHVSFWSFFFPAMLIDLIKLIEKTKCVSHPPLLLLCGTFPLNWPHHLFDIRPTLRRKMAILNFLFRERHTQSLIVNYEMRYLECSGWFMQWLTVECEQSLAPAHACARAFDRCLTQTPKALFALTQKKSLEFAKEGKNL